MAPTYYQIEVSARWLTVLLVALALLLVLAFAFGYGAAWSVLADHGAGAGQGGPSGGIRAAAAAPIPEEVILPSPTPVPPTAAPTAIPTAIPTRVPTPRPTATPAPTQAPPTATPGSSMFWVQVVAVSDRGSLASARAKAGQLGFPEDHQQVAEARDGRGNVLYRLRVGPLPDRASADRVAERMQAAGFSDAWVVTP